MKMIDPDKYVVFKRGELDEYLRKIIQEPMTTSFSDCPTAINDAMVIRKTDYFAYGALSSYASACLAAAEILDDGSEYVSLRHKDLMDVAEYFFAAADQARVIMSAHKAKIPTP